MESQSRILMSELSQRVTLEGMTVDVQIFRIGAEDDWILIVANESGRTNRWDDVFSSDIEAMAAFQIVAQEEGLAACLAQGAELAVH